MIAKLKAADKKKWLALMNEVVDPEAERPLPRYRRTKKQLHINGTDSYCPMGLFILAVAPDRLGSGYVGDVFNDRGMDSEARAAISRFNDRLPVNDSGWSQVIPWVEANF